MINIHPNRLRAALGFFLVILGPVSYFHLVKLLTLGEVVDSLVSAAALSLPFWFGLRAGILARRPFLLGLAFGLLFIVLIGGFWYSVPDIWRQNQGPWGPFLAHLFLSLMIGYGATRLGRRTELAA